MDFRLVMFFLFCLFVFVTILFGAGLYMRVMLNSVLKRVAHMEIALIPVSINIMVSSKFSFAGGLPFRGKLYIADECLILAPQSRYIGNPGFIFYFPLVLCNDVKKYRILTGTSNCYQPETFKISPWNSVLARVNSKFGVINVQQSIQIKPRNKSDYPKLKKLAFLTEAAES